MFIVSGTSRYATVRVHNRQEQGPCDDLYSLFYSFVECCEGQLPWKGTEDERKIIHIKTSMKKRFEIFLHHMPVQLLAIPSYLDVLTYENTPNYEFIRDIIKLS